MKLSEIRPVLCEGLVPIEIFMVLKEVLQAGKITNNAQTAVMANLCQFLKYESPNSIRYLHDHPLSSSTFDDIKNLDPVGQVDLAQWLYSQISLAELPTCYRNSQMSTVEWIKWVLRKQD